MTSQQVTLSHNEMLWLLDNTSLFTNTAHGLDIDAMQVFRLKLLSGLKESRKSLGSADVTLDIDELWLALETVKSTIQVGSERVGIKLIESLGDALLILSSRLAVDTAVAQVGGIETDEPQPDVSRRLQDWERANTRVDSDGIE